MTQVFLLGDGTNTIRYWPDPTNWNPVNTIECIGPGGWGYSGAPWDGMQGGSGSGGGGGAYAKGTNIVPTFPVPYGVRPSYQAPSASDCTVFNVTHHGWGGNVPGQVKASIGGPGTAYSGGYGGQYFYPTGFGGGAGGKGTFQPFAPREPTMGPRGATNDRGAGGGGAGGPNGAGSAGTAGTATVTGVGGAANGGTVAGGAAGANGNTGTQWDATHGCGSGAGGGSAADLHIPGGGGLYGGGSGGGAAVSSTLYRTGKVGADGLIILTYEPVIAPSDVRVISMCS